MNRRKRLYCVMILMLCCLVGCSLKAEEVTQDFFAMDTYMSLTARGKDAQQAITESRALITELESLISRTNPSSEIYKLNHNGSDVMKVSDMTYEIISTALVVAEDTDGLFDPTICAITDLWGIGSDTARVPSDDEIEEALQKVSYEYVKLLGDNTVQLLEGAKLDLGAIGKGYAADRVKEIYDAHEVTQGIIALGGNVYMVGEKSTGTPWNVGIVDPDEENAYHIGIEVRDQSVVTTGGYERFFEEQGVIYHHIFNPKTGYPTTENLKSVTVVSSNSTMADLYATVLFAMGYEKALTFIQDRDDIQVVMIREDDAVYVSDTLIQSVTLDSKYHLN